MSETPTIDSAAVQQTLAEKIESQEALQNADELKDIAIAEGNIQALRKILTTEDGEDATEAEAERAALKVAITETAAEHKEEGVSETLIMIWINGGDIATQLESLDTKGIKTYQDLKNDPEAIKVIQQIGVNLGVDLGAYGASKDGVDGAYGGKTIDAWAQVQTALKEAGYDLGAFGAAKDGIDGKVGKTTLNILMQAAKGVAPADVVETSAEDAKSPEAILAGARTEMRPPAGRGDFAPDDFIGPPAPTTVKPAAEVGPDVSDKARNEITAFVDTKLPGLKVEGDNLKHFAGADPLISQYIGADGNPVFTKLEADYHKENEEFAAENGVTYTQKHEPTNQAGFEHEGRFVVLGEVATADNPAEFLETWKNKEGKDLSADSVEPTIPSKEFLENLPKGVFYDEIENSFSRRIDGQKVSINAKAVLEQGKNAEPFLNNWSDMQSLIFMPQAKGRFSSSTGTLSLHEIGLEVSSTGQVQHPYAGHSSLNMAGLLAAEDPQAALNEYINDGFKSFATAVGSEIGGSVKYVETSGNIGGGDFNTPYHWLPTAVLFTQFKTAPEQLQAARLVNEIGNKYSDHIRETMDANEALKGVPISEKPDHPVLSDRPSVERLLKQIAAGSITSADDIEFKPNYITRE